MFLYICSLISASSSEAAKDTKEATVAESKVEKDKFSDEIMCYLFLAASSVFLVLGLVLFSKMLDLPM